MLGNLQDAKKQHLNHGDLNLKNKGHQELLSSIMTASEDHLGKEIDALQRKEYFNKQRLDQNYSSPIGDDMIKI